MTATRIELLELLAELSESCPEMRMGQRLANLATLARGAVASAIWDAEDQERLTPPVDRPSLACVTRALLD